MLLPPPPPLRPFSRPMLVMAFGLGVGVALAGESASFAPWLLLLAVSVSVAAIAALRSRNRLVTLRKLAFAVAAVLVVISLGGLRTAGWNALPPHHVQHLVLASDTSETDLEVRLTGFVADPPEHLSYGARVTLSVDSVASGVVVHATSGRIQVLLGRSQYGDSAIFPDLEWGDRINVTGVLRRASGRRNPADFDYGAYLRRQGVHGTMSIYEHDHVVFLPPTNSLVVRAVGSVRSDVERSFARFLRNDDARAIARALILGDRSGIDRSVRTAFAETGLMHLLAVSGLHVLLVGFLLYRLLKPILGRLGFSWRRTEFLRAGVTLCVLCFYLLLTGGAISVQRAFIMAVVWIGATLFQRKSDGLNTLGVAGIIILMIRPAALFDVGFQLSFAAVGALIVLVPILRQRIPDVLYRYRLSKAATDLVLTSVVATLGTAPVMLYHFGQLPLAGLVLNVIAIPATATALFGGLGTGLLGYHVPFLADAFAAVCELGTSVMMFAGEQGAQSLDWTVIRMFVREPLVVLALVSGLLVLAFWIRPRVRWRFVALTILLISLGAWTSTIRNEHQPRLDVLFLDVGQGDATLVTLPNGKTMLIDAGLRNAYTDHGTRTILPHLRRFGIDRLDAVVLTHADADHFGGALSVMEHIDVGRLIHSGHQKDNALWQRTLAVADSLGVPQRTVMAGDVLDLDASVRVRVLHPTGIPQSWEDGNDASVVLRLEYNNTSFLFTGDVEASGESSLVSTYGSLLASTVVKVAHHGSSTSSTEPFVDEAADSTTEFAVVSVAKRNRYGLPNEEPLARWITAGVDVLETAQEGAVWLQSNGTRVERVNWR